MEVVVIANMLCKKTLQQQNFIVLGNATVMLLGCKKKKTQKVNVFFTSFFFLNALLLEKGEQAHSRECSEYSPVFCNQSAVG